MDIEPAPKPPTKVTQSTDETLPPSGAPAITEDRKPIKKRRVLITDIEPKEATPQPIELVRQVATFWETSEPASATGISTVTSKPGPYSYEDFYSVAKSEGDGPQVRNPNVSDFKSLDDSSRSTVKPPAYTPAIPIIELMKPTIRLDEDEEEDIEEELNCLALSQGIQTIPRQRHGHVNSITPSPTLMGAPSPFVKKNSSRRLARVAEQQPSDFDPIPWSDDEQCAGLIESTIDFLLSMDLDGADSSKPCKYGDDDTKNYMSGTPLNSPTKAGKRVRFNPDANMTIQITPRRKLAVPVKPKHADPPKSRIEHVMVENPFFSPVKTIKLGQSSSAFSPKRSQHYFR
jgi:hypothetical protein